MTLKRESLTERRFREGTPETRFMADGVTVRCQAVSKGKLARLREERDDMTLTPKDVWPEAQCEHAALPNKLLCGGRGGHGGGSPHVPQRSLMDIMPLDLQKHMEVILENPQIISQRLEIIQLSARNRQLFERMAEEQPDGRSTTEDIRTVLRLIKKGNLVDAQARLEEVLQERRVEEQLWDEIRTNIAMLKDLRRTETANMKEFQEMASTDQILATFRGILTLVREGAEKYVLDPKSRAGLVGYVADGIRRLANARAAWTGGGSGWSGGTGDGDAQPVVAEALLHSGASGPGDG